MGQDNPLPPPVPVCLPDEATVTAADAARTVTDLGRGLVEEGIGGVLDPRGAIDRQAAQRELAPKFDVRDPATLVAGPDGPASYAGNQVSREDLAQIARTYSDIRLGRSDIQLNTAGMSPSEAERFRGETMGDIGNLLQTDAGRELVGSLANQPRGHTTRISQRAARPDEASTANAEGGAPGDAPVGSWADGRGTDAFVDYVPGDQGGIIKPEANDAWLPMRSDVTLFHEMVHAHHAAYGTLDQSIIENGQDLDTNTYGLEYQAVGLGDWYDARLTENTYRMERNAIGDANRGERTTGGVADDDIAHRTSYKWHKGQPPTP